MSHESAVLPGKMKEYVTFQREGDDGTGFLYVMSNVYLQNTQWQFEFHWSFVTFR